MSEQDVQQRAETLKGEIPLIRRRMEAALALFTADPSQERLYAVCEELVYAVMYGLNFHVPVKVGEGALRFAVMDIEGGRQACVAWTSSQELMEAGASIAVMPCRSVLEHVAQDEDVSGLAINPRPGRGKALIFLNRENARGILKVADESLEACPPADREALRRLQEH